MMTVTLCLISFTAGVAVTWAYASKKIAQIKRDDLSYRMASSIPHFPEEDAIRRAGV